MSDLNFILLLISVACVFYYVVLSFYIIYKIDN